MEKVLLLKFLPCIGFYKNLTTLIFSGNSYFHFKISLNHETITTPFTL